MDAVNTILRASQRSISRCGVVVSMVFALVACQPTDVGQIGEGEPEAPGERERGGPEHRAGQRCVDCHSEESHREGPIFVLAGTVYARVTDAYGVEGATVHVVDAAGHEFVATSNRPGNFMVRRDDRVPYAWTAERGQAFVPWDIVYPLEVDVSLGDTTRIMRSRIHREGSCAGCHARAGADAPHVGRVAVCAAISVANRSLAKSGLRTSVHCARSMSASRTSSVGCCCSSHSRSPRRTSGATCGLIARRPAARACTRSSSVIRIRMTRAPRAPRPGKR
jgi:mono/diheme cytochrome c family protein